MPAIHDVSEYITWNIPRPQFYVSDILPKQGVMLVYGEPKIGKSFITQQLGFSISVGDEWLGFRTEQARTLVAQFEIGPIAYAWRLRDMARNYQLQPQMLYEYSPGLMYLDEQEKFNRFAAAIRDYHPQVLILDPMAECFGGDENSGGEIARWIEKVEILKSEHQDMSVVIVHHTNKNLLSSSSVDRARGHSRLAGWVDTLLYLCPQPSGVQLQIKARQSTRVIPNIRVRFDYPLWHLRGGEDG